eukprot:TRINITY_DN16764_c0_g1_i4.p1 TRINITY_DN16764_c0_g1~~TRINITY_DN16764_c0_g1_i4.p1  ORF type:complete len:251 (+),score=32.91 TRINITY_DN16764_c0_g1_i4:394-1146(+)
MFGAGGGLMSGKAMVLANAGLTVGASAVAGGLATYWLMSIINTELLQLGRDNAGSFWFKKGRFKKPFLRDATVPAGANGHRSGDFLRVSGDGWSGVGGWLRFREISKHGEYTSRYLSISFSNYLRDGECKFFATYGQGINGTTMYSSRKKLERPGNKFREPGVSWYLRADDSERCVIDLNIKHLRAEEWGDLTTVMQSGMAGRRRMMSSRRARKSIACSRLARIRRGAGQTATDGVAAKRCQTSFTSPLA